MHSYGRYELLERLGRGGMAEVFLARMNGPMHVSRYVAIKRILPDFSTIAELNAMFLDEIRLVVHLSHPSIGAVYDFGKRAVASFLAMELIEGVDLRACSTRARRRPAHPARMRALHRRASRARARLCAQSARCRGAAARHRPPRRDAVEHPGVVPRRREAGRLRHRARRLARAALSHARRRAQGHHPLHVARAGRRRQEIDGRSDLFSSTTVLLEMVVGHAAFKADSDVQALKLVQQGRAPERDRYAELIPEDVRAIINRGMQIDREARFQTGEALAGRARAGAAPRAPAFGPADLGRDDGRAVRRGAQQHRARLRGFAESGRRRRRRRVAPRAGGGRDARGGAPPSGDARRQGGVTPVGAAGRGRESATSGEAEAAPPPRRRRGARSVRGRRPGDGGGGGRCCATARAQRVRRSSRRRRREASSRAAAATPPQPRHAPPPRRRVRRGQAADAGTRPFGTRPRRFGTLNLQSSPWARVTVDGKSVGQTPVLGLRLSAGRHRVTLANPGLPARTIQVVVPTNASIDRQVTLTD